MKKVKTISIVVLALIALIYYYLELPAINIHAAGFWKFFIVLFILAALLFGWKSLKKGVLGKSISLGDLKFLMQDRAIRFCLIIAGGLIVIYLIGSLLSSTIVNAAKYQQLLPVEEGVFAEDVKEVNYSQIPLLDRSSATILGNRTMGSLVDLASQFVVATDYTQINYQDKPVRVSPLEYASFIKWFTNYSDGIPAYIKIDMATQDTELVRLSEGMRYTPFDYFFRNLERHLRLKYPTYIFNSICFEIDDEGTPMWVCGVKKFNIGLFGGVTIGRVVICNAITGECQDFAVEDAPTWIDNAYNASLLVELYDYYGTLKHGWFNSIFGQRDCLQTTNGYNYLAIDDDVWVYTGVTSITSDQSNVGFVLINQRTMETKYYQVEGAIEDSAMSSAEGQVQNLGYVATFPLLLNVNGEPTYFLALKDDAGLVKKYAMMNVRKYQNVAIGDTVSQCEKNYLALMKESGIVDDVPDANGTVTGVIDIFFDMVSEGNSHVLLTLTGANDPAVTSDTIFDVNVAELMNVITFKSGDSVTLEYYQENGVYVVTAIAKGN